MHLVLARLVAARTASDLVPLPASAEGKLPEWFHAVPFGAWVHPVAGPFTVGRAEGEAIVAAFAARGIDLVIDWEHQSLATDRNGEPAPAAGWVDQVELRDDGVWAHVRDWTPKAAAQLVAREYRYVSPVVLLQKGRHPETARGKALHSIALTNVPFLAGDLQPLVARDPGSSMFRLLALLALPASATEDEVLAKVQPLLDGDKGHKAACKAYGLAETATPVELEAAVTRTAKQAELGAAVCRELKWDTIPADAGVQLAAQLKHSGFVPYADHVAALRAGETQVADLTDEQLLADCRAKGLLTPAMDGWAKGAVRTDRPGFLAWMRSASPIVPVNRSTPTQPLLKTARGLSDADKAVCRQLGIAEADYAKEITE